MARKGSQPALYELIRARSVSARALPASPRAAPSPAPVHVPALEAPAPAGGGGLPTGSIRLPVGYIYAGITILLLAIVVSYLYGVSVGDRVARERVAQQHLDNMDAAVLLPAVDPLGAGRLPPSLREAEQPDRSRPETRGGGGSSSPGNPGAQQSSPQSTPVRAGDPRRAELNYFILAQNPDREEVMVDFCRRNGLDAHVVLDDNGRRRFVIVLPGFAAGERSSPTVKELERRIRDVGLKWKNAARGNRDFNDAYPKKYQPR